MRVIKHGKKTEEKVVYVIVCPDCGCKFEAETYEFDIVARCPYGPGWWADIKCPDCDETFRIGYGDVEVKTVKKRIKFYDECDWY